MPPKAEMAYLDPREATSACEVKNDGSSLVCTSSIRAATYHQNTEHWHVEDKLLISHPGYSKPHQNLRFPSSQLPAPGLEGGRWVNTTLRAVTDRY